MAPKLEIGAPPDSARAVCNVTSDGATLEVFVTDGRSDGYVLFLTVAELLALARTRYGSEDSN